MAFIPYIPDEEIPAADRVTDSDNILRIHGINPPMLKYHLEMYRHLMYGQGPLSRVQREMVAVVVSGRNGCHY